VFHGAEGFCYPGLHTSLHVWAARISGWRESKGSGPQFRVSPTLEQLFLSISNRHKIIQSPWTGRREREHITIAPRHMTARETVRDYLFVRRRVWISAISTATSIDHGWTTGLYIGWHRPNTLKHLQISFYIYEHLWREMTRSGSVD